MPGNTRTILITGGNRGLGFELVKICLANGHNVFSIVRSEQARSVIQKHFPECSVVVADITDYLALIEIDCFKHGTIDVLINNAGAGGSGTSVTDTGADEVESQFKVHCLGAFNVTKAAYPALVKSASPTILNITSRVGSISKNASGEFTNKGFSYSYRIGKAAQNMLTQCLAQELGPRGFKVCALHPGRLLTSSGAYDAHMEPHESATRIYNLLVANKLENGDYYCVETGKIPW